MRNYLTILPGLRSALCVGACLLCLSRSDAQIGRIVSPPKPPVGIESAVYRGYQEWIAGRSSRSKRVAQAYGFQAAADGFAIVFLEPVSDSDSVLESDIRDLGGEVLSRSKSFVKVSLPKQSLLEVLALPTVRSVRAPIRGHSSALQGEGVALTGASARHREGFTGAGAKVAIIDFGFRGLNEASRQGEAPSSWRERDFTGEGMDYDDEHGTGVLEIIYEMAPGADYLLLNADDFVDFENAADLAIGEGANIINFSGAWYGVGFGDGLGLACDVVNNTSSQGVLWVNSAGNSAQETYTAFFADSDADRWHNVSEVGELIHFRDVKAGDEIDVWLTWNDWPRTSDDYDLALAEIDGSGNVEIIEWANTFQLNSVPVEHITREVDGTRRYAVAVLKAQGARSRMLKVQSINHVLEEGTSIIGSIAVPGDATGSFTVGAVNQRNWRFPQIEGFSSRGPTVDGRTKPDIVAPDGTASFSYPLGFFGTSAAAPHVAGAAAIVKGADPLYYTADLIRVTLQQASTDFGDLGKDNISGWGLLNLDNLTLRQALPAMFVSRRSVELDRLFLGEIATGQIQITNTGRGALSIHEILVDSPLWVLSYASPTSMLAVFEDESDIADWITPFGEIVVEDGRALITGDDSGFFKQVGALVIYNGDLDIEVDTQWLSGIDYSSYGILFNRGGSGNYRCTISGNGSYKIVYDDGSELIDLQTWTFGDVNIRGKNTLRVRRIDSLIEFSINDKVVKVVSDGSLSGGSVRLVVSNNQTVAFDNLRILNGELTAPQSLPAGESVSIYASAFGTATGDREGTISVITNDPTFPLFNISLRVSVGSRAPVITLSTSRLDFSGFVIEGGRGEQTLIVSNSGNTDLIISHVSSSTSWLITIPESATIAPGKSVSFLVVYTPLRSGRFSTQMTLHTNDPARPTRNIAIIANVPVRPRLEARMDIHAEGTGNQIFDGLTEAAVSGQGDIVLLEVFISPSVETHGGVLELGFDRSVLEIANVEFPLGFLLLGTTDSTVAIGSLRGTTLPATGYFATVTLRVKARVTDDLTISIDSLQLDLLTVELKTRDVLIRIESSGLLGDFDNDGRVGFADFLIFAAHFPTDSASPNWDPRFDLDGNNSVGFGDFLIFAVVFGK